MAVECLAGALASDDPHATVQWVALAEHWHLLADYYEDSEQSNDHRVSLTDRISLAIPVGLPPATAIKPDAVVMIT